MKVKLEKKKSHQVYKTSDGRIVPGASTIAGVDKPISFLMEWAYKQGQLGVDHRKVTDESADAGSVGHFLIEHWLKNNEVDLSDYPQYIIEIGHIVLEKFKQSWRESNLTFVASEISLVSEEFGYGGTLDLIARDAQNRLCLVDEKTSKMLYESHFFQLAGYERLWNENKSEKIQRRAIFRNGRKDNPKDTELRWMGDMNKYWDVFYAQLQLYKAKRKI